MDERLEKAMEHANYMITLSLARKNLELKYRNELLYSCNGGIFTISAELLNLVDLMIRNDHPDGVFIDDKNNPILIDDLKAFQTQIMQAYFAAQNTYHAEFEKLRKARNVKTIVGL